MFIPGVSKLNLPGEGFMEWLDSVLVGFVGSKPHSAETLPNAPHEPDDRRESLVAGLLVPVAFRASSVRIAVDEFGIGSPWGLVGNGVDGLGDATL